MTFDDLCNEVYAITNHPEMTSETVSAVKAATLKAHNSDFYFKDLFEGGVAFDTSAYLQTLSYRDLVPNYRSLKYIRKYDAVGNVEGDFLTIVTPDEILDDYKVEKQDIAYVAGSVLQIKMSTQEKYFLFGCYVHPVVATTATYNSWIAAEYPYAIVYEAAAKIFGMLQKTDARDYYLGQSNELLAEIRGANLVATGF